MIYLDNAATGGYKPDCVKNAVLASLKTCANAGRSGHRLSVALAERVFACRRLLKDLFGAPSEERVVFTKNCTEALNLAIFGALARGGHAVTTALEHNSVLRPLEELKNRGVISYSVAPLTDGVLKEESIAAPVTPNTKAVIVTCASNVTGQCPDLKKIRALIPREALLIVDGAQGAGYVPLDMSAGVDALCIAGHKGMHAIQGAGALLLSARLNPAPLLFGATGSESQNLNMPALYPDRLEAGTLSYPALSSLFAGALVVKAKREEHRKKLLALTEAVICELNKIPRYRVYSRPNPVGIVSFAHQALPSEEVAAFLCERYHIAVRSGLHCAPLVHEQLATANAGLVRASFSPYQGMREARALLYALQRI